jgi:hypothetical protein
MSSFPDPSLVNLGDLQLPVEEPPKVEVLPPSESLGWLDEVFAISEANAQAAQAIINKYDEELDENDSD